MRRVWSRFIFVGVACWAILVGFALEAAAQCEPGKLISQDTAGNCCWPGQAWSGSACVGDPTSCPEGFEYTADQSACELLACAEGLVRAADQVHCCWPGQGWSSVQGMCVGSPQCAEGYLVEDGACVAGPTIRDTDGDGIVDALDECPLVPEDFDGFEDEDGCPDYDNDGDGIPDVDDQCPNEPEDFDGFRDEDGCPDYDNDDDGVPDTEDKCPLIPGDIEDRDNPDADGCPRDDDGDGIINREDQCPLEPEDFDGFEDEDGCPDYDNDGDGIPDVDDKCPNEPEDYDLFEDEDGCPDPDNDGDGVPDVDDLCPHEKEDGLGKFPNDGCAMPAAEKYAVHWFPSDDYTTIGAALSKVPSSAGGYTYLGLAVTNYYTAIAWGQTLGLGWGQDEVAGEPLDIVGGLFGLHLGIYPLQWPNFVERRYTLINPVVGAHFQVDALFGDDRAMHGGAGLYLSNAIMLGEWVFGAEYRGVGLFDFGAERTGGTLSFFIGGHTL